jgi:NADH-quinone oxidoreductase subunit L
MTAFYMFRLLYLTFFKEFRGTAEQKSFTWKSNTNHFPQLFCNIGNIMDWLVYQQQIVGWTEYLAPLFTQK